LITPKDHVLLGITRKVVVTLARNAGLEVEERDMTIEEMRNADEAFLTASFKEVVPVVKVDDQIIGDGKVGPVTKKVIDLFYTFTRNY
jgi:branched-subunit amino acid aminotransferase/4-amino-4-deoxychorismate lyase